MLIGLTGGMGCGKSTVLKMFADLGCPVFSADAEVARLLDTPRVGRELMAQFGADLFDEHGGVDKRALAWIVFAHPSALSRLEDILHPHVRAARLLRRRLARRGQPRRGCFFLLLAQLFGRPFSCPSRQRRPGPIL